MLPLTAPLKSPVAGPIVVFWSIAPKLVMSIPPTGTQRRFMSSGWPAAALDLGFPLAEANASNKSAEDRPNTILVTLRRVIRALLRMSISTDNRLRRRESECFPCFPIAKRRDQNRNSTTTIRRFAKSGLWQTRASCGSFAALVVDPGGAQWVVCLRRLLTK